MDKGLELLSSEIRRKAVLESCNEKLEKMDYYDENEIYSLICQCNHDKGFVKKVLNFVYNLHKKEEEQASYDEQW